MSEALGEAVLDLRVRARQFEAAMRSAKRQAEEIQKTFDRVGRGMQRFGAKLSLATTLPFAALVKKSLDAAGDLIEIKNIVRVTFGESAKDIEAWADTAAKATHRSATDFLKFSATFGSFLKPLGVAPQLVAPMSKALSQLVLDVSSFRNLNPDEVMAAFFSGLAGQTEAVRRLGINLSAAAVDQKLLELGFKGGAAAADEGTKALARFLLIMEQTQDAQGDVIRTSDSWKNSTRALSAAIGDLFEAIGAQLIPIFKPLVQSLTAAVRNMINMDSATMRVVLAITGLVSTIGPLLIALGGLLRVSAFALKGLGPLGKGFKRLGAAAKAVGKPVFNAVRAIGLAFFGVPGMVAAAVASTVAVIFFFRRTLAQVFSLAGLRAILQPLGAAFQNYVLRPLAAAANFFTDRINDILNAVNKLIRELQGTAIGRKLGLGEISLLGRIEVPRVELVTQETRDFFVGLGEQFKQDAREAGEIIRRGFKSAADIAGQAAGAVSDAVGSVFRLPEAPDLGLPQLGDVSQFINDFQETAQTATEEVGGYFDDLGQRIGDSIANAVVRGENALKALGNVAKDILAQIASAFISSGISSLLEKLGFTSIFSGQPKGFATGGRPPVGVPSIVGERGPELFVPDRPGTIIPNHKLGGTKIEQRFNFPLAFPPQLEAFVRNIAGPAGRDAALQVLRAQAGRI